MYRAKLSQDNYGGKGLMDIHPDYVRSQMGYPPVLPSRFNRLDPSGIHADDEMIEDKYLNPSSDTDMKLSTPQTQQSIKSQKYQSLRLKVSQAAQNESSQQPLYGQIQTPNQVKSQRDLISVRLTTLPDGESQTKEEPVIHDRAQSEAPTSLATRTPQEVGLKQAIRRSGSLQLHQTMYEESNSQGGDNHMVIQANDYSHKNGKEKLEKQENENRFVRFAQQNDSKTVTFSPRNQSMGKLPSSSSLLKNQRNLDMPLQRPNLLENDNQPHMVTMGSNFNGNQLTYRESDSVQEAANPEQRFKGSQSTQGLQRQLQELRHMQNMQFPGNSPPRAWKHSQNVENMQYSKSQQDLYTDYYNKYYERQKQQEPLRTLNHQFAINQQKQNINGVQQQQLSYKPEQAVLIGLGQPQNLAAFDLPLSQRMSRENKSSSVKMSQGQGASLNHQSTAKRERNHSINEGTTPIKPVIQTNQKSVFQLHDGGLQRAETLGKIINDFHGEAEIETSLNRASKSFNQFTPRLDANKKISYRNSHTEASGWKTSRTSMIGSQAASHTKIDLVSLAKKISPAQAVNQGARLHAVHKTHQLRKAQLREEFVREEKEQMQDKPKINQRSREMVQSREKITRELQEPPQDFVNRSSRHEHEGSTTQSHQACMIAAFAKLNEERKQCTHKPKINRKSRTLIEKRILENLQKKAELYKMQNNTIYQMSKEGILIDMPKGNRPPPTDGNANQGMSSFDQSNAAIITPNKYQIPLNQDVMAKNHSLIPMQELSQHARQSHAIPMGMHSHQFSGPIDWKQRAIQQLLQSDTSVTSINQHQFSQQQLDDKGDVDRGRLEPSRYQLQTAAQQSANLPLQTQASQIHHQQSHSLDGTLRGAKSARPMPEYSYIVESNSNHNQPLQMMPRMMDQRQMSNLQAVQSSQMSATFSNPVIQLQSLNEQNSQHDLNQESQRQGESMQSGANQSLRGALRPDTVNLKSHFQYSQSNGGNISQREQMQEQLSHKPNTRYFAEIESQLITKKSLKQRIEEKLEAQRSQTDARSVIVNQRQKSQNSPRPEFREHSSSKISVNSAKSKKSQKSQKQQSKGKTKNFIVLNAEQLKRIQSTLSKHQKGSSQSYGKKPNLFEQKKIKIKKGEATPQNIDGRPTTGTHEQHLDSIFGQIAKPAMDPAQNAIQNMQKMKQNADLNKDLVVESNSSHQQKRIKKIDADNFFERNLEWQKKIRQKLENEKKMLDRHEMGECSFTPRLAPDKSSNHDLGSKLSRRSGKESQRNRNHYNDQQVSFEGVHYAEYHKFRAEAAPKTYRELDSHKRDVHDFLEKNAPVKPLRTERREQERQRNRAGLESDQSLKSENVRSRVPIISTSRSNVLQNDSDRGALTHRTMNFDDEKRQINNMNCNLHLKNSETEQTNLRQFSQSNQQLSHQIQQPNQMLQQEIHSIQSSLKSSVKQKEQRHEQPLLDIDVEQAQKHGGVSSFLGKFEKQHPQSNRIVLNTQSDLLQQEVAALEDLPPYQQETYNFSDTHGPSESLKEHQEDKVDQRVRRLGSLYMQRSSLNNRLDNSDSNRMISLGYQHTLSDQKNDTNELQRNGNDQPANQNAQNQYQVEFDYRFDDQIKSQRNMEEINQVSGRSNPFKAPLTASSIMRLTPMTSRQSQQNFQMNNGLDGKAKNPSSFDNTSLPVGSSHRDSMPIMPISFHPTPRTLHEDQNLHQLQMIQEVPRQSTHDQHINQYRFNNQQEEGQRNSQYQNDDVRRQSDGDRFNMQSQQDLSTNLIRESNSYSGNYKQHDPNMPVGEFTLRQPTDGSNSNPDNSFKGNNVPRISAPENSSMQSQDWQISQNSAPVVPAEEAHSIKQNNYIGDRKLEAKRSLQIASFDFQQRYGYGMAAEPILEKESENATYSINEGLSNMSKIVSVSENNSQYDFLQHVTSVKDKHSQGGFPGDEITMKEATLTRDGWQRPKIQFMPHINQGFAKDRNSQSSNQSPMDLYSGLNKDLALMQLRNSIMDKSLDFSRENQSDVHATESSIPAQLNSLTTMSLEAKRQNNEVQKIRDEIKRWNQMQQSDVSFMDVLPGQIADAQMQQQQSQIDKQVHQMDGTQGQRPLESSEGYLSKHDYLETDRNNSTNKNLFKYFAHADAND